MSTRSPSFGVRLEAPPADRDVRAHVEAVSAAAGIVESVGLSRLAVAHSTRLDTITLLGSLAARSAALELALLAEPAGVRPPSLFAKAIATLDLLARGSLLAGLAPAGTGAPGVDLGDALEVCRAMGRVPAPHLAARTFSIEGAHNEPRPARPTRLAVLATLEDVRAGGEATLAATRFADAIAVEVGDAGPHDRAGDEEETVAEMIARVLDRASLAAGRTPGELELVLVVAAGADGARQLAWAESGASLLVDADVESLVAGRVDLAPLAALVGRAR